MSEQKFNDRLQIAPPLELTPKEFQIYQQTNGQWQISFVAIGKVMDADYSYLRSQFGKSPLNDTVAYTVSEIKSGDEAIEKNKAILEQNPDLVIMDENARFSQIQVVYADALRALIEIIPQVNKSHSLEGLNSESINKLLAMLTCQYQMRTGVPIDQFQQANATEQESNTAKQIRLAYKKLSELV